MPLTLANINAMLLLKLAIIIGIPFFSSCHNNPYVTTPSGLLAGTILESRQGIKFYAFRGIRYAEPPIEELRFKPPVPVKSWEGVYNATQDIRACSQPGYNNPDAEDCLFLNVYTRRINNEGGVLRPVMIFIHGGGFHSSTAESWAYGPDYIMDNDVVLVSLNYRLATLGFLSTGDESSPGNFGMKDQVEAMRWVKKNIKYFGGDQKQVTLLGENAGSACVLLHLISPMSRGRRIMFVLLSLFLLKISSALCQNPVVTLPSGQIAGTILSSRRGENFYAFRGVRYAQPPVGELRFKPPVPVEPWEGIYDATHDIRACSQPGYNNPDAEDCLFLNIYTRRINGEGELRPVMFWIHGGGFYSNTAESWAHGPDYIMDNDVVLVTHTYRLATLGFLSTGDQYSPGNYGMKDQVEALRWVQKNIQYFGGDPNRVTIAGESAGSASVILHLVSPMSRGLFHRAIAQSGSAANTWATNKDPLSLAKTQAALLNCPTDTSQNIVNCIKQYPAQQVSDVYFGLLNTLGWNGDPIVILAPVVETVDDGSERFLVKDPLLALQEGDFANVPLIIGTTKDEFASKAVGITQNAFLAQDMSANWNRIAPISFIYEPNDYISSQLRQYYLGGIDQPITTDSYEGLGQLYADSLIIFGTVRAAKLIADKNSQPVYLYQFNYQGQFSFGVWPGTNQPIGVLHSDDLIYLYFISQFFPKFDTASEDGQCVTRLTTLWSNFMEYGNPTPEASGELDNVIWSPLTTNNTSYLDINKNLTLVNGLYYQDRMSFWENLLS